MPPLNLLQVTDHVVHSEKYSMIKLTRICYSLTLSSFFIVTLMSSVHSVIQVKSVHFPDRLENASRSPIVLDCIYTLDEKEDTKGFVVKWFFMGDPAPIYQWIPEVNSRSFSKRLEGKVDTNYTTGHSSRFQMYRAIKLVKVTTDLSGTYSCNVQSFTSQGSKQKDLIVYASPKKVSFGFKRVSDTHMKAAVTARRHGDSGGTSGSGIINNGRASPLAASTWSTSTGEVSAGANLTCEVTNVSPKPHLIMYGLRKDGSRYLVSDNVSRRETLSNLTGAHSIVISALISDSDVHRKYNEDSYHVHYPSHEYIPSTIPDATYSGVRGHQRLPPPPPPPPPSASFSYPFECVSSIDIKLPGGNLTKVAALAYTPSSSMYKNSPFYTDLISSIASKVHHRPSEPIALVSIFTTIIICTVSLV